MDESGFEKYDKVHGLQHHTDEVGGMLNGSVHVFEKLDGANASVWMKDGTVYVATRNRVIASLDRLGTITILDPFRGLAEHVFNHPHIIPFVETYPHLKLCGEWLIKHTINYPPEFQNQFYVFDVKNQETGEYLTIHEYAPLLNLFPQIKRVPFFAELFNPTLDGLKAFVGMSELKVPDGEGIVLKNYDYRNKWGRLTYGKIVTKEFREINAKVFGGPIPREAIEMKIAATCVTHARVRKVVQRIEDTQGEISIKDTARVISTVYYDVITEEMWTILKQHKRAVIDFGKLQKECNDLTKNLFFGILNERIIEPKREEEGECPARCSAMNKAAEASASSAC